MGSRTRLRRLAFSPSRPPWKEPLQTSGGRLPGPGPGLVGSEVRRVEAPRVAGQATAQARVPVEDRRQILDVDGAADPQQVASALPAGDVVATVCRADAGIVPGRGGEGR